MREIALSLLKFLKIGLIFSVFLCQGGLLLCSSYVLC